jgi:hypothetical protein
VTNVGYSAKIKGSILEYSLGMGQSTASIFAIKKTYLTRYRQYIGINKAGTMAPYYK